MSSSVKALKDYTLRAKYARYNKEAKRRETYEEATNRTRNMMLLLFPGLEKEIDWAYDRAVEEKVLGSQRALQFGGKPAIQHNARIYNCLAVSTQFITQDGVKSFSDYLDGDTIIVLTHKGNWKKATVRKYGVDDLHPITLQRRGAQPHIIWATSNHRWLLADGTETTNIQKGDLLQVVPNIFSDFSYETATPDERMWWAYGFVFGDGTKVKDKNGVYRWSMVRLCGEDKKYRERFEELGFVTSSPKSFDGDIVAYTGNYLKEAPNVSQEDPRHIKAFVRGYLDADGGKQRCQTANSLFTYIQATGSKHINFIREAFPVAGIYIYNEKDLTGQVTNYGVRPHTIRFSIGNTYSRNTAYRVIEIGEKSSREEVWCLEVEDDHSFVMPNGVVTGNCTSSFCDRLRFFQEALYLLLCGCGTGFSVQKHHIAKLPQFAFSRICESKQIIEPQLGMFPERKKKIFTIPDNIEGWSDALGVLLSSYFENPIFPEYYGCEVVFRYHLIRPEGSHLSSGAGKAPGPEPLRRSLEKIRELLDRCLADGQTRLRPIDAYDIVMHASDAVLAGGIRRSATICIFSPDDLEMLTAKTGDWFTENPQRGRSNNSVLLLRGKTSRKQFFEILQHVKEWGEPGFYWSDSTEQIPNPCVEVGFWPRLVLEGTAQSTRELLINYQGPVDYAGDDPAYEGQTVGNNTILVSGWQFCNLTTINGGMSTIPEIFYEQCIAATGIGTFQAAMTKFPYLGRVTELIVQREALLGVSITAVMDNPQVLLNPDVLRKGAQIVLETNERLAKQLGINPCARSTLMKPEGTATLMLGSLACGLRPWHAKKVLRRVQANHNEPVAKFYASKNPHAVEKSVWCQNGTTDVITFCVEAPENAIIQDEVDAIQFLKNVETVVQNWIRPGKRPEQCTQPWLTHNVSNTVVVRPDEWDVVGNYIYDHRDNFAGVALLPYSGDKDYRQAPFVAVYNIEELVAEYGEEAVNGGNRLLVTALDLYGNDTFTACEDIINRQKGENKHVKDTFVSICRQFAWYYFGGDFKRLTYLIKDLDNLRIWNNLQRAHQYVDYNELVEEDDSTTPMAEAVCAGGACSI